MKLLLKLLLQMPLLFFLVVGIDSIISGGYVVSFLVGFGTLLLYTTGDYLETGK